MSVPPSRVLSAFRAWGKKCGRGHFHNILGVTSHNESKNKDVDVAKDGTSVIWRGNVSRSLVRKHGRLELAAVLALFDEISTWSFFTGDSTCRPGVSVKLSASLAHGICVDDLPRAGDEISVQAKFVQSGRTLGYATAQLTDAHGKVLATGNHHKHLPMNTMNPLWDTLFSPTFRGAALWYLERQSRNSEKISPHQSPDSLDTLFADNFAVIEKDRKKSSTIFSPAAYHCNPMGSVHGGLTAMLAAESAGKHVASNCHALTCSYIRAARPDTKLRTTVDHRTIHSLNVGGQRSNIALANVFCDTKSNTVPIFAAEYHF